MVVSETQGLLTWDELSALVTDRGYKPPQTKDFRPTDDEPIESREEAAYEVIKRYKSKKELGKCNPQG